MQLTGIDWAIIVGYFVLTIGIGVFFTRRAGKNLAEFFVSGRSLPWWIAGTSMVATTFAADTPLAVTGLVVKNGLAGNWFWWAFALGGMFTVFVYARLWRRAEVMTDVELIRIRYGGTAANGLRYLRSFYVALIVNPIIIGWVIGAMLTVLEQTVFFDLPAGESAEFWTRGSASWAVVIGMLVVVGVYCTLSGMWGVAISDMIQFCLAMGGCIWLAIIAVNHVGGVDALADKVETNFGSVEALSYLPSFSGVDPWMPLHVFLIMLTMQWWATWYPGAEPGGGGYVVQRMASCKDERHSVLATLWYQVAHYCVRPWPWIMISFVALAMYPELRANYLADNGFDPGVGFPMVMRELCGPGLAGLMLVAFFAAFMSTISTQMNWGASYLVRDFVQPLFMKEASDKQLTNVSRVVSVIVLLAGLLMGYLMKQQGVGVDDAWKLLAALGAGTGLVFMLRWFWWRINAWSEIVAMIASLVYFLLVSQFGPFLLGNELRSEETMAIVAVLTIFTWLIATFLTPPESADVLREFFRKIRPGGPGWKPIANQEPDVDVDKNLGMSILAALFAAGLVYLTIPALGYFIFGQFSYGFVCLGLTVVCAVGVGWSIKKMY